MMKKFKRWIVLAVVGAMAVSLSACGLGGVTADDAVTYVQGELDAAYRGQYNEDYLELMDMTSEEASETHVQNVSAEALYLLNYIGVYDVESMPEEEMCIRDRSCSVHDTITMSSSWYPSARRPVMSSVRFSLA